MATPIPTSLDPRIRRLGLQTDSSTYEATPATELITFQCFWQQKAGKPYEHAGIVHGPDADMALLYAKEQYSRRGGTCFGMAVAPTSSILETAYLDDGGNAFDALDSLQPMLIDGERYEIYALKKRGKQHQQLPTFTYTATQPLANQLAAIRLEPCSNMWLIPASAIVQTAPTDSPLWDTLPDKRYRDAVAYKSADKIAAYKARQSL